MVLKPLPQAPRGDENWIIEERSFDPEYIAKCEAIFTQGNGYLGQRAALDEHYWGETRNLFVSGTFDRFHESEVSELPNLPDVTNISFRVGGKPFSMQTGRLEAYSRKLNLYTGELTRNIRWTAPDGTALDIGWSRVVSMENVHLQASRMTLTADRAVELTITSGIDGTQTNSGTQHMVEGHARVYDGSILEYPCETLHSHVQVVTHASHRLLLDGEILEVPMKIVTARRYLGGEYALRLEAGQTLTFEKLAQVCTSRDLEEQSLQNCLDSFRRVKDKRYAEVFSGSAAVWQRFWAEHDVRIESSNPRDQVDIRFAIYHLNIMTNHRDSRMGVAAKGLSREGYKGHSFWDTEIFIFPFFLFNRPETARNLLEYRYNSLPAARELARKRGYKGAMYPWESGWIGDGDVTPDNLGVDLVTGKLLPCQTGELEQHITADIAFAVYQYYNATRDDGFMEHCGYEILVETARFWASRTQWNERLQRYEINSVIGPDEYQVDVNNNAYTNFLAARNMELGAWALERLGEALEGCDGLGDMLGQRLQKLYLPQPDGGIVPQFDGYLEQKRLDLTHYRNGETVGLIMKDFNFEMLRSFQAAKQADVIQLMVLWEDLFPEKIRRVNYLYYEPRTLHDSSLSKTVHSILASDLGMTDEAYQMFRGAADTDLGPQPHSSDDGIHSANMGGMWQAVVMGFGGLRMVGGSLRIRPHLPKAWQSLRYRLRWQGSCLTVRVTKDMVRIQNEGACVRIETVHGPMEVAGGQEVSFHYE